MYCYRFSLVGEETGAERAGSSSSQEWDLGSEPRRRDSSLSSQTNLCAGGFMQERTAGRVVQVLGEDG